VTDLGLRAVGRHCPALRKLSVRGCEMVTDEGIQLVAYSCRALQHLNIQVSLYFTLYSIFEQNISYLTWESIFQLKILYFTWDQIVQKTFYILPGNQFFS